MNESDLEELYSAVRSLSTLLFVSPFTREDLARALASDRYEELLAQLLSCLAAVSREQREESEVSQPPSHKPYRDGLKFPSVVVVGYRAIKEYRELVRAGPGVGLWSSMMEAGWYCLTGVDSEHLGHQELLSQVDFWDLGAHGKLQVLLELLNSALSARRIRCYLEDKAGGLCAMDCAGEDGSLDQCSLCEMEGELVCCDSCPRVFHTKCLKVSRRHLGSDEVDWTCPECRGKRKGIFDQPRLPTVGYGGQNEVFWLGDNCLIEGSGKGMNGSTKVHRGESIQEALNNIQELQMEVGQNNLETTEAAPKAGNGSRPMNYVNQYLDKNDPSSQTLLDKWLRKSRLTSKRQGKVQLHGMPSRFRYTHGEGPEGFCKSFVLCLERALGGLLEEIFWPRAGAWTQKARDCTSPTECGRLLLDLLGSCRSGLNLMDWNRLEDQPKAQKRRREDDVTTACFMEKGSWGYHRGKFSKLECANQLPQKELRKLARSAGMYKVEGVYYKWYHDMQQPPISCRLKIMAVLECSSSWSLLADALLQLDSIVNFGAFDYERSTPWGSSIVLGCSRQDGLASQNLYEVKNVPFSKEGMAEKLVAGDMPLWLVKSFEDDRRQKFEEKQAPIGIAPRDEMDPKEFCGICKLKDPILSQKQSQLLVDWICCDKCDQWFHQVCLAECGVRIKKKQEHDWACPDCKKSRSFSRRVKHKRSCRPAITPTSGTFIPPDGGRISKASASLSTSFAKSSRIQIRGNQRGCLLSIHPDLVPSSNGGMIQTNLHLGRSKGRKRGASTPKRRSSVATEPCTPKICPKPSSEGTQERQRIKRCKRVACGWIEYWERLSDDVPETTPQPLTEKKMVQNSAQSTIMPKDFCSSSAQAGVATRSRTRELSVKSSQLESPPNSGNCDTKATPRIKASSHCDHRIVPDIQTLKCCNRTACATETKRASIVSLQEEQTSVCASAPIPSRRKWRSTARDVLENAPLCQQWLKTTKHLKTSLGLGAVQTIVWKCANPEEIVARLHEVIWGWDVSTVTKRKLMNIVKAEWVEGGLDWPRIPPSRLKLV